MNEPRLKYVCVFCGSALGQGEVYAQAARTFADALCDRGLGLVYGGAQRGLMGVLADRVLERGGKVIGVMPQAMMERELAHAGVTELLIVPNMHVRKAEMAAHADAFVALPGGYGTLDELMEALTWSVLGLHDKPIGLYDAAGYFGLLKSLVAHMAREGFVAERHEQLLHADGDAMRLLAAMGL